VAHPGEAGDQKPWTRREGWGQVREVTKKRDKYKVLRTGERAREEAGPQEEG